MSENVFTLQCVYITMCLHYNVFTLRCVYITMCLHYNVFTLQCVHTTMCSHYNVFTLQCVYTTMCLYYNVFTLQCVTLHCVYNTSWICTSGWLCNGVRIEKHSDFVIKNVERYDVKMTINEFTLKIQFWYTKRFVQVYHEFTYLAE